MEPIYTMECGCKLKINERKQFGTVDIPKEIRFKMLCPIHKKRTVKITAVCKCGKLLIKYIGLNDMAVAKLKCKECIDNDLKIRRSKIKRSSFVKDKNKTQIFLTGENPYNCSMFEMCGECIRPAFSCNMYRVNQDVA